MSDGTVFNWIARVHDPLGRPEDEARRIITEALTGEGFTVASVHKPLQLNPEPLRIRKPKS